MASDIRMHTDVIGHISGGDSHRLEVVVDGGLLADEKVDTRRRVGSPNASVMADTVAVN